MEGVHQEISLVHHKVSSGVLSLGSPCVLEDNQAAAALSASKGQEIAIRGFRYSAGSAP